MALLTWIAIGFIGGVIAFGVRSGSNNTAAFLLILLSILGASAAGWWSTSLGWEWGNLLTFNHLSALAACAGAIVSIVIFYLILACCQRTAHWRRIRAETQNA